MLQQAWNPFVLQLSFWPSEQLPSFDPFQLSFIYKLPVQTGSAEEAQLISCDNFFSPFTIGFILLWQCVFLHDVIFLKKLLTSKDGFLGH